MTKDEKYRAIPIGRGAQSWTLERNKGANGGRSRVWRAYVSHAREKAQGQARSGAAERGPQVESAPAAVRDTEARVYV